MPREVAHALARAAQTGGRDPAAIALPVQDSESLVLKWPLSAPSLEREPLLGMPGSASALPHLPADVFDAYMLRPEWVAAPKEESGAEEHASQESTSAAVALADLAAACASLGTPLHATRAAPSLESWHALEPGHQVLQLSTEQWQQLLQHAGAAGAPLAELFLVRALPELAASATAPQPELRTAIRTAVQLSSVGSSAPALTRVSAALARSRQGGETAWQLIQKAVVAGEDSETRPDPPRDLAHASRVDL